MRNVRWIALAALCMALLLTTTALADGEWAWQHTSRRFGSVDFAMPSRGTDGWLNIDGLGGKGTPESVNCVQVISKNASVWQEPRTGSKKLGSVSNGERVPVARDSWSGNLIMQNGFYGVVYRGMEGYINSDYVVFAPFEIVLMESNVPAYCAPSTSAKKVGSLAKLTRYTVVGVYDSAFYVIQLRGGAAFVPFGTRLYDSRFEQLYADGGYGTTLRVNAKTSLRTGPGTQYAAVRDVNAGSNFACMDVIDGWYMVMDAQSGCYAYISPDYALTVEGW